jgi:hypothetical protein
MKNRVVYLVQEPTKSVLDLTSAHEYGRIETLLTSSDRPTHAPGPCLKILRDKLAGMKKDDFIMWAGGDMTGVFLAGLVIAELPFKQINVLRWERQINLEGERTGKGFYMPVTVNKQELFVARKDHELYD